MTVYVDNAFIPFRRMIMCHLIADSTEELLAMADTIHVSHKWIQKPGTPDEHFDICKSMRECAIRNGAIEITMKDLAVKLTERRRA